VADASCGLRRRFTRNFAGGRELNDGRSMAIDLPPPNLPRDLYLFLLLSPVAFAIVSTAPVTALAVFRPTFLTLAFTPDKLRLLEARFFERELVLVLEDLDCFLDDCLKPPEATPPAFLVLLAAILSLLSFVCELRPPGHCRGGMKTRSPHPLDAGLRAA
jgi:hypothetical protein